jgi:putative zinc finger/helix-turn-helix YgiT family protein
MVIDAMTCFECGNGTLIPAIVHLTSDRHGESFTVEVAGLKCNQCGFETVDSEQSAEFTRLVSDEYRVKHGLLTSAEIRARRLQLRMTQQQFSDHLGAGVASVKRWESGQIQENAMDQLIRLKTDPTAARENLKKLEQQLPEQLVLSEGKDVTLVFAAGRHSRYVHPHAMSVGTFFIVHQDDLAVGDNCVAA